MKPNKANPFNVPDNYFEALESSLLKQTIKRPQNPFKVSDHYFETLEYQVLQKTVAAPKRVQNTSFYAIAAVMLVLVLSFFWMETTNMNTLPDETLEWVLLEEMNSYELASFIENDNDLTPFSMAEAVDIDLLDYSLDFNETNTYENSTD